MNETRLYIEERRPTDCVGRRILIAAAAGYGDIGNELLVEAALSGHLSTGDTLAHFVGLELREITEGAYPGDDLAQWCEAIRRIEVGIEDLQGVLKALRAARIESGS